jgi:hypothetical protein
MWVHALQTCRPPKVRSNLGVAVRIAPTSSLFLLVTHLLLIPVLSILHPLSPPPPPPIPRRATSKKKPSSSALSSTTSAHSIVIPRIEQDRVWKASVMAVGPLMTLIIVVWVSFVSTGPPKHVPRCSFLTDRLMVARPISIPVPLIYHPNPTSSFLYSLPRSSPCLS